MKILIIDGQGGGIGRALAEKLKQAKVDAELIGVGTNSAATTALLKAGVDGAATGENAVIYQASHADVITGSTGILSTNAMLGEISPAMVAAISASEALKVLIPLNQCNIRISGVIDQPLPDKIDAAVAEICALL